MPLPHALSTVDRASGPRIRIQVDLARRSTANAAKTRPLVHPTGLLAQNATAVRVEFRRRPRARTSGYTLCPEGFDRNDTPPERSSPIDRSRALPPSSPPPKP